jgi:hypothetical protein
MRISQVERCERLGATACARARAALCRRARLPLGVAVLLLLAACSGSQELLKNSTGALNAPAALVAKSVDAIASIELPKADSDPIGTPTEIYTRIAHGAQLCWFGTHGTLKGLYIFHADAAPPSRGGMAEIIIHERDAQMPNPRGNRAFRVQITPAGENASLMIENIRFSIEAGHRMTADVRRWARNDLTCRDDYNVKGWDAESAPTPAQPPAKAPTKIRERRT